jgi:hypothetical protein
MSSPPRRTRGRVREQHAHWSRDRLTGAGAQRRANKAPVPVLEARGVKLRGAPHLKHDNRLSLWLKARRERRSVSVALAPGNFPHFRRGRECTCCQSYLFARAIFSAPEGCVLVGSWDPARVHKPDRPTAKVGPATTQIHSTAQWPTSLRAAQWPTSLRAAQWPTSLRATSYFTFLFPPFTFIKVAFHPAA